ncbi:protein CyaE [Undibacterium terreum]|uniref:Protein CyaE n=2 Tax=Undibacterium terreum TaxID=1224302 RepID=A0A916XCV8_9BURK|nr:protein CyaE [Undibacterium terreum]
MNTAAGTRKRQTGLRHAQALMLAGLLTGAPACFGLDLEQWDIFNTEGATAGATSSMLDPSTAACSSEQKTALSLMDVVVSSLCNNPRTKAAWATVRLQAAQVGVAKSAYLPTLTASAIAVKDTSSSRGSGSTPFNVDSNSEYQNDTLTLNWMLYDFGLRSAALEAAKKTLASALASQNTALQTVFSNTVNDYYNALVAQKNALSTREIEADAKRVLDAAKFRVGVGVVPISDQLQAQTSYSQAVYNRNKAEGARQSALGILAIDMGRRPNAVYELAEHDAGGLRNTDFVQSVDKLLEIAQQGHPSLLAARADLEATQSNVKAVSAEGRPSLSLIVRENYNTQPTSSGFGQIYVGSVNRDRYIGLQLNIPVFEGFSRTYKVRAAQAQVESKQASLADTEQQVAANVWTHYQELKVNTDNLQTTQEILDSAQSAFEAAVGRYKVGVADIVELINTQTALANAHQQRTLALAGWQNARIQLAAALGTLGLWAVR